MELQENATAPDDFESLRKTNEVLLLKNEALCLKNKNLIAEKEALQKRIDALIGQEQQDTSSFPEKGEMDEIDSQEHITTPEDCESFCQANQVLIHKNRALCIKNRNIYEDIEALQETVTQLICQKTRVSSWATEFPEGYAQNCKFWGEKETLGQDLSKLKNEKLIPPVMDETETQTSSTWQDMKNAHKLSLQEREPREAEKKKSEVDEKEQHSPQDMEYPQEQLNTITKEAKMNLMAWDQEREILHRDMAILTKQKCEVEETAKEAKQTNKALQKEVLELQMLLQKEKQQNDMNEARFRAHTMESRLRAELEEGEAVHSFDELLQAELLEEVNALREKVKTPEEKLQSQGSSSSEGKQSSSSEHEWLSLRRRFVRLFVPGWRRCYSSQETVEYAEPREQDTEEIQGRLSLMERFVSSCTPCFRRRRT
ncbi:uncharacterized protein AKAME5_002129400 [Lates japonicus]|uniref:Uncharacterized protein n=1 Tax=Lates japonicus TaxID=270547 RepID=A0AAD3RIK1_LATJO|nr:uncharacterized protein AKAME5_002129400 [Lates japonicus]